MESSNNSCSFDLVIDKIVSSNRIMHAYIIQVNNYDEDFLLVKRFVKTILCKEKKHSYETSHCNFCNICSLVDSDSYPDLYIIEPDGREIKKTQLLGLQREFQNKSLLENKRIYILKEADKLNESAANTILKFLEEPADDIVAILVTTNRYKMLETILSRCQVLSIQSKNKDIVYDDCIVDLVNFICSGDELFINYNDIVDNILPDKTVALEKLKVVEEIFVEYLSNRSESNLAKYIKKLSDEKIVKYTLIIEEYLKKLQYNVNYKLWLDSFFARLLGGDESCMML